MCRTFPFENFWRGKSEEDGFRLEKRSLRIGRFCPPPPPVFDEFLSPPCRDSFPIGEKEIALALDWFSLGKAPRFFCHFSWLLEGLAFF